MNKRVYQALTLFVPLRMQLEAARSPLVIALVNRGFPRPDAEDIVQDVLGRIERRPGTIATRIASVQEHVAYFVNVVLRQRQQNSHGRTSLKRST